MASESRSGAFAGGGGGSEQRFDDTHGIDSGAGAGAAGATVDGGAAAPGGAQGADDLGVDHERLGLVGEAAAPIAELSAQIEGQLGDQMSQVTSWSELTGDGVDIISICFMPAWHLSDDERKRLSTKLARMLDLLCPVKISPVWEAVIGVGLTCGGIAASRAMTNGGRLPAFGPQKAPAPPVSTQAASSLTE